MVSSHTAGPGQASIPQDNGSGYRYPLIALTSLFFMWGFITCLNDILIPHLKNVFSLNYTQAMLIQFCFFGAYFIVSLPAGRLVQRIGYKSGLIAGLMVAGLGCLLFYPAATSRTYLLFLAALFVLASGITILQVSANPYVTVLGPQHTASSRLNLTQAFNSLGTTVAPFFGALLILSAVPEAINQLTASQEELAVFRHAEANAVKIPYLILAITLFGLALLFTLLKLPVFSQFSQNFQKDQDVAVSRTAWSHSHLVLGAIGIFVYVGAEVSIGSLLINFLAQPNIADLKEAEAANYVAYYWGGAMVGRFVGAAVMTRINPGRVLAINAGMAAVLVLTAVFSDGNMAMYSILLVGLCNSIMFPTIFSLALKELGAQTSQGSGILCLAIVGGALIPLLHGTLADLVGLQAAYVLPAVCYLYILFYGLKGSAVTS